MRNPLRLAGRRGVSPIVGEVLMIAVVMIAMSAIAWAVISGGGKPERQTELLVRLENASPPDPDKDSTFDNIRVILYHVGGDSIGIPKKDVDEFCVFGLHIGENTWENTVPWDNWVFSDEANGFQLGENVVGYLRHDDATISIGDKIKITVLDLYSGKPIYARTKTVENSSLYV